MVQVCGRTAELWTEASDATALDEPVVRDETEPFNKEVTELSCRVARLYDTKEQNWSRAVIEDELVVEMTS